VDIELLRERARIIREVRRFFDSRGYLSVDTPSLAPDLIPETCLEVFETRLLPPLGSAKGEAKPLYLVPSPEIHLKKLIARHKVNIYEICRCFRNCEPEGRFHSPQFTMLEFYTMDAGYLDSLALTEALFAHLGVSCGPFLRFSMEEAFRKWAGFSLEKSVRENTLVNEARSLGLEAPDAQSAYNLVLAHCVEPGLPPEKPAALLDYPALSPTLAKKNASNTASSSVAVQRWELYWKGVELANCYTEEDDPAVVKAFFEREGREKAESALVKHAIDNEYWKIFEDFPPCSGVALGLDRLIALLTGRSSIEPVVRT